MVSAPAPPAPGSFWLPSASLSSAPTSSSGVFSSPSSSFDDFAVVQARVLGLSSEYQAVTRWFCASGGDNFPAYVSAHFPHLYSDFRIDFSSGSSRFLAALSSAPPTPPPPVPVSSSPSLSSFRPPAPRLSAPPSLPSFSSSSGSAHPPSLRFPAPPVAPVSSLSLFPSHPVSSLPQPLSVPSSLSFPFAASRLSSGAPGLPQVASFLGVSGSPGALLASTVPVRSSAPRPAPSLFRLFASMPSSSVPVSSAPPLVASAYPSFSSSSFAFDSSAAPPDPLSAFSFGLPDDLPEDSPPDALPHVFDPPSALPESARSEFRRMMSFIVDLFPQAAGSPFCPSSSSGSVRGFLLLFCSSSSAYLSQLIREDPLGSC